MSAATGRDSPVRSLPEVVKMLSICNQVFWGTFNEICDVRLNEIKKQLMIVDEG
jgi:F0F1-type ATP synthase membrane subunit b/b'